MIKVAINGFGRIGRSILRAIYESGLQNQIDVVAINELAPAKSVAHLLQYDSTHGRFQEEVIASKEQITVAGKKIVLLSEPSFCNIHWDKLGIDVVIEATGKINDRAGLSLHLKAGAKKVLVTNPASSDVDNTIIYGINDHEIKPTDKIISGASCTTNCAIPVIQLLDQAFGVTRGAITTIHSAMNDQQVIDSHQENLRLARAAGPSIIPVDTKLARGIDRLLPHLHGKFEAISVRVPTQNVTAMDVTLTLAQRVDIETVNQVLKQSSEQSLQKIVSFTELPLVSTDFNHDPHSCIVDGTQTRVSDGHLVKMLLWCDNEWGFANRMLDIILAMEKN